MDPATGLPASATGAPESYTHPSMFALDYIAPSPAIAPYITTLYHFRCDEREIRDVQPAAVGHVLVFLMGEGEMIFAGGRRDRSAPVSLLAPCTRAAPIEVSGPFHCIGAALSPLGWAALTRLDAAVWADRLMPATEVLGAGAAELGARLIAGYRAGQQTGAELCGDLERFLQPLLRPINQRHAALVARVAEWLGGSIKPELADLVDGSGYSVRQVQRLCERYYGLPPLGLVRKYRALRVVALLGQPGLPDEEVAGLIDHFYDQSHMIREIRTFAGRTPGRLIGGDNSILSAQLDLRNFREISPLASKESRA